MRLTKQHADGYAIMDCDNCEIKRKNGCTAHACRNRLKDRLAAYEDTGLEPEEISDAITKLREYEKTEDDGRLLRLPCKVGDKVYCITSKSKKIVEDTVEDLSVWSIGDGDMHLRIRLVDWRNYVMGTFGDAIFSTREEAEKALEGANNERIPE